MKKYITAVLISVFFLFSGNSSILANNFIPVKKPDKTFKTSSKSRTIEMKKGETYSIKMKLRKNRLYFMSVKGKKKLGEIQYRIIDPNNNNKVIFDNSAYEFDKKMTFFNDKERNVIIEIRTMPCCFEAKTSKKRNVQLVFANKKIKTNEKSYTYNNYNLCSVF